MRILFFIISTALSLGAHGATTPTAGAGPVPSSVTGDELLSAWRMVGERRDPRMVRLCLEDLSSKIPSVDSLDEPLQRTAQNILYALGTFYLKGEGGPVNMRGAFDLFERSGVRGHKKLALLYDAGLGVFKDPRAALVYYGKDSSGGSLSSQFHRARQLLHEGKRDEAIKAYEALLEVKRNYTTAQSNLAVLLSGHDDERARFYRENALMHPDHPMSAMLIAVFEDGIGPPPMVDYVDPGLYEKEAEELHAIERGRPLEFGSLPTAFFNKFKGLKELMNQLVLFAKAEGNTAGRLDYLYVDPYAQQYRPTYRGAEEMDPTLFVGEMLEAYDTHDPKARIVHGVQGRETFASFFEETTPLIRRALSLVKETLEANPQAFVESHMELQTKDPERILRIARSLFVDLMVGRLDVFGERRDPLILWHVLDHMLWDMRYHQIEEDQSLGMGISKAISQFKRSLFDHAIQHEDPFQRVNEHHAFYTFLGHSLSLVDGRDISPLAEMVDPDLYGKDFYGPTRSLVRGLVGRDAGGFYHPRYTRGGLVQLMKRALFDARDQNITVNRLIAITMVDEELRGHYYHTLFMNPQETDFFDPYAEDSQKGGGALTESASLIFGDKTFETLLRRFGYLASL